MEADPGPDLGPFAACVECGNDDPCEGFNKCSDCLETTGDDTSDSRTYLPSA